LKTSNIPITGIYEKIDLDTWLEIAVGTPTSSI